MPETKAFPRKKKRLMVEFLDSLGMKRTGYTHDLSYTGFFVKAGSSPKLGEAIKLMLHLPDGQKLELPGRVARQTRVPLALSATMPSGFGFALTAYSEEYTRFVDSLLTAL